MKILSVQCIKRFQFVKWGSRITCTGFAVRHGNIDRRLSFRCCRGSSYVVRHLVSKFRVYCKRTLRWQRSCPQQYNYDLYNYSLNFDDGVPHESVLSKPFSSFKENVI